MTTEPQTVKLTLSVSGKPYDFTIPTHFGKAANAAGTNSNTSAAKNIGHPLNFLLHTSQAANEAYLSMIYNILSPLPKQLRVTDLMGGIGMYPKILWDQLEPVSWDCVELDPDCEPYFQEPRANFILGNAYSPRDYGDLVIVDIPNGTLRTMATNTDGRRGILENIAKSRPKYFLMADFGHYWVHLPNHRPWYQEQFGVTISKDNYPECWDKWYRENYGYKTLRWAFGGGSAHFLMVPI